MYVSSCIQFWLTALTFATAIGVGTTRCVTGAAFKEVNIVGLNEGLSTIPGPAEGHDQVQLITCTNIRCGRSRTLLGIKLPDGSCYHGKC